MNAPGYAIATRLPVKLDQAEGKTFLLEVQPLLEVDRPRVVLDCSQLQTIDSVGVEILLHCLDEAMKRDGDLKLAALSPVAAVVMELMRADRVFEIFETVEEAVRSFDMVAAIESPQTPPWYSPRSPISDLKAAD